MTTPETGTWPRCSHPGCDDEVSTSDYGDLECVNHVGDKANAERNELRRRLAANFEHANTRLEDLITGLREHSVRTFKGQLYAPDGSKLWDLDIVFERPPMKRPDTDTE